MPQLTWLITGCSSWLGDNFIRKIIERGDKAIATTRGDVSRISELVDVGAKAYSLDVTWAPAKINATINAIIEKNGDINVLVNNAGYIEGGIAEEISYERYLIQFETNFFGLIKTTQAILPHFRKRKSGTIVHIGSMGGISGQAMTAPYCAAKFALEGWHDSLQQELAPLNIRSIIFELGFFRTKISDPSNFYITPSSTPASSSNVDDYKDVRDAVIQFVRQINGTQRGDPKKAVEIIIDVVKGEGVAEGKQTPDRLCLGKDVLEKLRWRSERDLEVCRVWEDVIASTDIDSAPDSI